MFKKLLLISASLLALTGAAKAEFVAAGGVPFEQGNFALNLTNGTTVLSGFGTADGILNDIVINTNNQLGIGSNEHIDLAGGNATITPDGQILTSVSFDPLDVFHFTSFSTRGQLNAAGNVFITVNDNLGQTFTFLEAKDQNWTGGIGVEAVAGSGEFITSVTVWTDNTDGFKEIKQQTFGFQTEAVAAVPELSTWFMMILGFAGVGLAGMRKARSNFRWA